MLIPCTERRFINQQIGYGIFATQFIPAGTITWILDKTDQILSQQYINALEPAKRDELLTYCYRNNRGDYIYSSDNARFINHSFKPNCILTPYEIEISVQDIQIGEELTVDYGFLNIIEPFQCLPEPGITRTIVYPNDLLHYHEIWDEQIKFAIKQYPYATQPLQQFLAFDIHEKLLAIANDAAPMDSILNCFYRYPQLSC